MVTRAQAGGPAAGKGLEDVVREIFEQRIPFNRHLGLVVESLDPENLQISFRRREWMIGNFVRGALHGGIVSSVLDVAGGLAVFVDLLASSDAEATVADRVRRLGAVSTIDLRIDYLRSALAERYVASCRVLRSGSRVAVTRSELRSEEGVLVAAGTASYRIASGRSDPSATLDAGSGAAAAAEAGGEG